MAKPEDHLFTEGTFTRDAVEGIRGQAKAWSPGRIEQDKVELVEGRDFDGHETGRGSRRQTRR